MSNIKKYFYPEFYHFYEKIIKYYPQVLNVLSELIKELGKEIKINSRTSLHLISYSDDLINKIDDNFQRGLFKLLLENIETRNGHDEFVSSIIRYNNELDIFANVISRSTRSLIGTHNYLQKSLLGGVEYFQYVGTKIKCRNFCKNKIGKHYHINEIAKMDNKEIGPVFYFSGGLGCYHAFEGDPFYKKKV